MKNQVIGALLARGFGGSSAAAVPGAAEPDGLPTSSSAAGVEEVCEVLLSALDDPEGAPGHHWVFLVGGPGNGKSFQVATVLNRLGLAFSTTEDNSRAPRSALFDHGAAKFLVVNDASIRTRRDTARAGTSLFSDLVVLEGLASQRATHALINVNRGILVEELQLASSAPQASLARPVLAWLNGRMLEPTDLVSPVLAGDYYSQAIVDAGYGKPIFLHAVFLDQLSLLERRPGDARACLHGVETRTPSFDKYTVMRLLPDRARLETPAGKLLAALVEESGFERTECSGCRASASCPFLANARNLRDAEVRAGVLAILRSAEIASGHLLTYRELWSACATLVIGPRRAAFASRHPCEWIAVQVDNLRPTGQSRAEAISALSEHRFFNGLYSARESRGSDAGRKEGASVAPVLHALSLVDPVTDAIPRWASVVNDALDAHNYGESPIEALRAADPLVKKVVVPLDEQALDPTLDGDGWAEMDDATRREVLWRHGLSLYRLYATLKGVPAHKSVIDEWLALRSKVEPQATDLPPAGRLSDALKSLLLPPCSFPGFERECLLPVFTPRVEPVTTSRDEVTWCYSVSMADEHALTWRIRARGDGLWVSLDRRGEALAEFHLDFALCREALTHLAEGRTPQPAAGFSELGMNVSPRLERIRASILGHGANARLTQFPVVVRSSARRIEIG